MKSKKRILVAPINWGLGHATRCVPIINMLLQKKFEVVIAAEGRSYYLLKNEFPKLEFINIPGVNIRYYPHLPMLISMIIQIPHILLSIYQEHLLLKKIIKERNIDGVVSDNRFGLYNRSIPTIFITHQLNIKSPILEGTIQRINYYFINKFSECWILDNIEEKLSGDLASPNKMPKRYKYIGPQSRFKKLKRVRKYDLLAIISGPEPRRTLFEKKILKNLTKKKKKSLVILGKTEEDKDYNIGNCRIISHCSSSQINEYMMQSEIIICRSGYSTIMDLKKLESKAILIPTPGQTEQEYLSKYLQSKGVFFSIDEDNFNINNAIKEHHRYTGFKGSVSQTKWEELFSLF